MTGPLAASTPRKRRAPYPKAGLWWRPTRTGDVRPGAKYPNFSFELTRIMRGRPSIDPATGARAERCRSAAVADVDPILLPVTRQLAVSTVGS